MCFRSVAVGLRRLYMKPKLARIPLLPNTLDFGTVRPGNTVGDMAGLPWGTGQVTAAIVNDNSGGLFTGLTLGVYDVDCSPPGGGGGPLFIPRPPQCQLIQVAIGDGTQPLPVATGQIVAVGLFFNAPAQVTGKLFTAT